MNNSVRRDWPYAVVLGWTRTAGTRHSVQHLGFTWDCASPRMAERLRHPIGAQNHSVNARGRHIIVLEDEVERLAVGFSICEQPHSCAAELPDRIDPAPARSDEHGCIP